MPIMSSTDKSKKRLNNTGEQITLRRTALNISLSLVIPIWICCAALAAFLLAYWVPEQNNRQLTNISQQYANHQLATLEQMTAHYQSVLEGFAKAPHLQDVLPEELSAIRHDMEQDLTHTFPAAESFLIIPLGRMGIAGLKQYSVNLRNSIEIDMVRQASEGKTVPVEAYQYDGQWLMSFAQTISPAMRNSFAANPKHSSSSPDTPVGSLLLTLKPSSLQTITQALPESAGHIKVTIGKNPAPLFQYGHGASGAKTISLKSDSMNWTVHFTPSENTVKSSKANMFFIWVALAVLALIIPVIAIITNRQYSKKIQENLFELNQYSEQCLGEQKPSLPNFSIEEFGLAANLVSQLGQKIRSRSAEAVRSSVKEPENTGLDTSLQIDNIDTLDDVLDLDETLSSSGGLNQGVGSASLMIPDFNPAVFRAYDIRGMAETDFTDDFVSHIGMSLGSEAIDHGQQSMVLGYDGRLSSPRIKDALINGIRSVGCHVIDLGLVPTPLMYFATHHLGTQSGVMITGSHNPPQYNGFKVVIAGKPYADEQIQGLKRRIEIQHYKECELGSEGGYQEHDISAEYIDTIINDVAIAQPLKVVVDCGNGAASNLTPALLHELGCDVIPLFCEVDGNFPNHHPDPSVMSNLNDLIHAVREHDADIGLALDGDGDRLGVVTRSGNIVLPDKLLMLFAQDVVSRNPGTDVIFDVKSTRHLNQLVSTYGGRPIMWKSGHSYIKQKMQETGALLGGELSGHFFFKERWFGFDDGTYAAARLIEILSITDADLDGQIAQFPNSVCTPELHIPVDESRKFELVERLKSQGQFDSAQISDFDGIRADYPDGWGLVRPSNTTPVLTLRFEADTPEALMRIKGLFMAQLQQVDSSLTLDI